MFPFDIEEEEPAVKPDDHKEPADYEIDFSTGCLTGRILTGIDAVGQRVKLVLGTDRYYFPQYSWDYGNELSSLIGKNYNRDFVKAEAKRMVEDALASDKDIEGIEDFECMADKDRLTVKFRIRTIYGDAEVETGV